MTPYTHKEPALKLFSKKGETPIMYSEKSIVDLALNNSQSYRNQEEEPFHKQKIKVSFYQAMDWKI